MSENSPNTHDEKTLDRYFEFFKHITTLNSAAIVVLIALYRDVKLPDIELLVPAIGFSASLLYGLHGLWFTTDKTYQTTGAGTIFRRDMRICILAFIGGFGSAVIIEGIRTIGFS